jgi:hypothetical protein
MDSALRRNPGGQQPQQRHGSNDRMIAMPGSMEVFGCVPIRGLVAAANVAALQTQAQVHPVAADFQKTLRSFWAYEELQVEFDPDENIPAAWLSFQCVAR